MPGRFARGEGTNKVSVRQGRGYAGALPTALREGIAPRSSRWRIVRGRRIMPTRGGSANSVLPSRSLRGLVRSAVRGERGGEQQGLGGKVSLTKKPTYARILYTKLRGCSASKKSR